MGQHILHDSAHVLQSGTKCARLPKRGLQDVLDPGNESVRAGLAKFIHLNVVAARDKYLVRGKPTEKYKQSTHRTSDISFIGSTMLEMRQGRKLDILYRPIARSEPVSRKPIVALSNLDLGTRNERRRNRKDT